MTDEEIIRNHYIFSTTHELDDDNKFLKEYILNLEYENTQLKLEKEEAIKSISHYVYERDVLKQQLKDKDEKISNLIKLLIEMVFDDIDYLGVYQELVARHLVKLGYIVKEDGYYKELESNKED